jgi:DNA-binding NtrC family response regulator
MNEDSMSESKPDANQLILCIDDEAVILMALAMELRRGLGPSFIIETATSLEDLLEVAAEYLAEGKRLACVITDWIMPGARGEDIAQALRRLVPGLPVLLMTGHSDTSEAEKSIGEGGIFKVVKKPWRNKELLIALNELLNKT